MRLSAWADSRCFFSSGKEKKHSGYKNEKLGHYKDFSEKSRKLQKKKNHVTVLLHL